MTTKPAWRSKKVWASALALLGAVAAHYTGNPDVAPLVVALGMALVVAIGLADFGKEGKALEAAAAAAVGPEPEPEVDDDPEPEDDDE